MATTMKRNIFNNALNYTNMVIEGEGAEGVRKDWNERWQSKQPKEGQKIIQPFLVQALGLH